MEWKHIDTLQMGPPSNKERVGNMDMVKSRKEVEVRGSVCGFPETGEKVKVKETEVQVVA